MRACRSSCSCCMVAQASLAAVSSQPFPAACAPHRNPTCSSVGRFALFVAPHDHELITSLNCRLLDPAAGAGAAGRVAAGHFFMHPHAGPTKPMFAMLYPPEPSEPRPILAPSLTSMSSEEDIIEQKRQRRMERNRIAAAGSRRRKRLEMERLQEENMRLQEENKMLNAHLKSVLSILLGQADGAVSELPFLSSLEE